MEKSSANRQTTKNSPKTVSVGRLVVNAIRNLQGRKGIPLKDLKRFLRDQKNLDIGVHGAEINMILKNGIQKGLIISQDGNYKVKESKRRRSRSRSRKRSSGKRRRSRKRKSSGGRKSGRRSRRRRKAKATEE